MIVSNITNTKVPLDRSKCLLSLCGYIWLTQEIKKIKPSNTEKLKRYKRMTANRLAVESPVIVKKDHFVSCIEDRSHGTLLIDKKVKFITFDNFLKLSSPMSDYDDSDASQIFKDIAKNGFDETKFNFVDLISSKDNFSKTSMYWVTKDTKNNWIILYDCIEDKFNFNDLVKMVFREYDFESISLTLLDSSDQNYPTVDTIKQGIYDCGSLILKDFALKEKTINFKFYNLNLLNSILN